VFVTHDLPEAIAMCSRVVIMTARPGRIKSDYTIDLPRHLSTTERRLHPDFQSYYSRIWDDLREEVGSSLAESRLAAG
jgi:NitT/TauT family transport system ATP-binding protein